MSRAIENIRKALYNESVTGFDRAHVELLYINYDKLINRVLEVEKYLAEPDRTNKLDIVQSVVDLAKKMDGDYPRRTTTRDEIAEREYVRDALSAVASGETQRARANLRLLAGLRGIPLDDPRGT